MPSSNAPKRSFSHIKEDQSKRNFEEIIQPWYVLEWIRRDYGVDGLVEVTAVEQGKDYVRTTGKYFLVQIKSRKSVSASKGTVKVQVEVKNVNTWLGSSIPILFVLNGPDPSLFYYLWIDEQVLLSLESKDKLWDHKVRVTLQIPEENVFKGEFHDKLKDYLLDIKRPARKDVAAGQYFSFQNRSLGLVTELETIVAPFNFASLKNSVIKFKDEINQSIYRIAITGLSRVGKSSFINTLLKKPVCPVGFFQTTSVPIQIVPDKEECVHVVFINGSTTKLPYSFEAINEYASQDENEDNKKGVRLVSISVLNDQLQRGISIYDIPGLNDPDEDISAYSWSVASKANAIMYVVDATPAQNGGYIFHQEYKKHISDLGQSLDKVFLIFNKSDSVPPENLQLLKDRVIKDLKKLNLYDKVNNKIYYITTIADKERPDFDSVSKLENDLWNFILNENKFGMYRLSLVNHQIGKSIQDFTDLLRVRVLETEKRLELKQSIQNIKAQIPTLDAEFFQRSSDFSDRLNHLLENKKNTILLRLEQWLKSIPLNDPFPSNKQVKDFLKVELNVAMDTGNREFVGFIHKQKEFIDNWIESHLKQLREILSGNARQRIFDFKDIEDFTIPIADISTPFGMSLLALAITYVFAPPIAFGAFLFTLLSGLVTSSETIRIKRTNNTVEMARSIYDKSFQKLSAIYKELILEETSRIERYASNKLSLFFDDIELQMKKLQNPMTPAEKQGYQSALLQVKDLQRKIHLLEIELLSYKI